MREALDAPAQKQKSVTNGDVKGCGENAGNELTALDGRALLDGCGVGGQIQLRGQALMDCH